MNELDLEQLELDLENIEDSNDIIFDIFEMNCIDRILED